MQFRHILLLTGLFGASTAISLAGPGSGGDADKGGALIAERCAGCHGADGNSQIPGYPNLAGQHVKYLLSEFSAYRSKQRDSEIMRPMVEGLTEQDELDIAAFLVKQKPAPGQVTNPSLLALGKKVYLEGNSDTGVPSCDGCHETEGEGSTRFPRVAGQNVDYTLEQFRLYATGKRPYGKKVMRTVAERLSEKEARAVAEYMASLP